MEPPRSNTGDATVRLYKRLLFLFVPSPRCCELVTAGGEKVSGRCFFNWRSSEAVPNATATTTTRGCRCREHFPCRCHCPLMLFIKLKQVLRVGGCGVGREGALEQKRGNPQTKLTASRSMPHHISQSSVTGLLHIVVMKIGSMPLNIRWLTRRILLGIPSSLKLVPNTTTLSTHAISTL